MGVHFIGIPTHYEECHHLCYFARLLILLLLFCARYFNGRRYALYFAPRGRRDFLSLISGPFPAAVLKTWDTILDGAIVLRQTCMYDARAPKAGAF